MIAQRNTDKAVVFELYTNLSVGAVVHVMLGDISYTIRTSQPA